MNKETPRTDAYEREFNANSLTNGDVEILNFARQLERELSASQMRVKTLEGALRESMELIHSWHGDVAWEIYDEHSPEMKRLHAALKGEA